MDWRILTTGTDDAAIAALLDRRRLLPGDAGDQLSGQVRAVIDRVRADGDAALVAFTRDFDRVALARERLRVPAAEIRAGTAQAEPALREAIGRAADNIRRFHERQRRQDLLQMDPDGGFLAYRYLPMARIGAYVPGGAAGATPLISSVLMNVIPAQIAGVSSIAVCSPPRSDGSLAPGLLCALDCLGVDEVYRIGGAQAIAALAYGTESIAPVDKVVGPGNKYVTEAKRQVFGRVGLDMLAGPSEVAIIADETADPRCVAADLLAQAEHDTCAGAILLTPGRALAAAVTREIDAALAGLSRASTARASLATHGGAVITRDLEEALMLSEQLAPEHLELIVAEPLALAARVRKAGAVFIGPYSPEALGDYVAGTNHVLPTNGTARFTSGLGVDDFLRRLSLVSYSRRGFAADGPFAVRLAEEEGLTAHALSLLRRLEGEGA
ncbi:MAG: histidinol dehydrogenase [Bacteroidota bacterium]